MANTKLSQRQGRPVKNNGDYSPRTRKILGDCDDIFRSLQLSETQSAELIKSCDYDTERISTKVFELLDERGDDDKWESVGKKTVTATNINAPRPVGNKTKIGGKPEQDSSDNTIGGVPQKINHKNLSAAISSSTTAPRSLNSSNTQNTHSGHSNANANSASLQSNHTVSAELQTNQNSNINKNTVIKPVVLPANSAWSKPMTVGVDAVQSKTSTNGESKADRVAAAISALEASADRTEISHNVMLLKLAEQDEKKSKKKHGGILDSVLDAKEDFPALPGTKTAGANSAHQMSLLANMREQQETAAALAESKRLAELEQALVKPAVVIQQTQKPVIWGPSVVVEALKAEAERAALIAQGIDPDAEEKRRKAEEKARIRREAEEQRSAAEAEILRIEEEEAARKRLEEEADLERRRQAEEAARLKAEEARAIALAEAARIAAEEEAVRLAAVAAAAAAAEASRLAALKAAEEEAAFRRRLQEEEEARLAALPGVSIPTFFVDDDETGEPDVPPAVAPAVTLPLFGNFSDDEDEDKIVFGAPPKKVISSPKQQKTVTSSTDSPAVPPALAVRPASPIHSAPTQQVSPVVLQKSAVVPTEVAPAPQMQQQTAAPTNRIVSPPHIEEQQQAVVVESALPVISQQPPAPIPQQIVQQQPQQTQQQAPAPQQQTTPVKQQQQQQHMATTAPHHQQQQQQQQRMSVQSHTQDFRQQQANHSNPAAAAAMGYAPQYHPYYPMFGSGFYPDLSFYAAHHQQASAAADPAAAAQFFHPTASGMQQHSEDYSKMYGRNLYSMPPYVQNPMNHQQQNAAATNQNNNGNNNNRQFNNNRRNNNNNANNDNTQANPNTNNQNSQNATNPIHQQPPMNPVAPLLAQTLPFTGYSYAAAYQNPHTQHSYPGTYNFYQHTYPTQAAAANTYGFYQNTAGQHSWSNAAQ